MNIIERNFFRLLRSGAFGSEEQIEALSAWKWNRLFQLSEMHDVSPIIYKGIERCSDQFFVQVPEALKQQWSEATSHDTADGAAAPIGHRAIFHERGNTGEKGDRLWYVPARVVRQD